MNGNSYTDEEIEQFMLKICEAMEEEGASITEACKKAKVSKPTFYKWLDDKPKLESETQEQFEKREALRLKRVNQYGRARVSRADYIAEENRSWYEEIKSGKLEPAAARVMMANNQWHAGKLNKGKYGTHVDVTTGGEKLNTAIYETREIIVKESNKVDGDALPKE